MGNLKRVILLAAALPVVALTSVLANAAIRMDSYQASTPVSLFGEDIYQSNRYTQTDDLSVVDFDPTIPEGFAWIASSDPLDLYYGADQQTLLIRDQRSDYLWSSRPELPSSGLSASTRRVLSSLVVLEYFPYVAATDRLTTSPRRKLMSDATISTTIHPNGIDFRFEFVDIEIAFTMEVRLENGSMVVRVPSQSIVEAHQNIASIAMLPQFGGTRSDDVPGYVLIPDGPGALYRFKDNGDTDPIQFSARYYGADSGIKVDSAGASQSNLSMPVYGMVHGVNQHGFLAVAESGDTSAQFVLIPSGANGMDYNATYTQFILRENYILPTNNKGSGIPTIPSARFVGDIAVRFLFADGEEANYVGLAGKYRARLHAIGVLPDRDFTADARIEWLMEDSEPGLFGMTPVVMSDLESMESGMVALTAMGVNAEIALRGWNRGGWSLQSPYPTRTGVASGGVNHLKAFIESMHSQGSRVSLIQDYTVTFDDALRKSGVTTARGIHRRPITYPVDSTEGRTASALDPISTLTLMERDRSFFDHLQVSVLQDGIGYRLFSTYSEETWWNREASVATYLQALQGGSPSPMIAPNAYLWAMIDAYFDVPLYASQYQFYDDTIPFLPLVLSGSIDMYSPFVNYFANPLEQWLRLVDFGVKPSYLLTAEPTTKLRHSAANHFYSTTVSEWLPQILLFEQTMGPAFEAMENATLASRTVVSPGLVRNTYDNGTVLYINYGDIDQNTPTGIVSAKSVRIEVRP